MGIDKWERMEIIERERVNRDGVIELGEGY